MNHFSKLFCLIFFFASFFNQTRAQWVRKADELYKRAECNNVVYQGKIYMFGGFGDNPTIEKTNEVYDIALNKWSRIASFPAGKEITHQGIVLVDDNIWLIGGRAVDAHGPVSSQVIIYNITTNTWADGPELINPATGKAFPIGAGGYALLGRTIHVFGGFGPTICEDQSILHLTIDVDRYIADRRAVTWENKSAPMPIPRNHLSYVVLAGKIYALGGQFKHDCGATDQIYCHVYDSVTDTWTRLTDLPVPRSHAEAATFAIDDKIFLVGGQGKNNITQNTTYQFDPKPANLRGSWATVPAYKLPGSFLGLSARLVGKSFIIMNGALDVYSNERKETYIAQIARSANRTLGFTETCFSATVKADTLAYIKNLLYCIEDAAAYTLSSDAAWLSITKSGGGVTGLNGVGVEAQINTGGLLPGTYTAKVTATSLSTGSEASFCVNLKVEGNPQGYILTLLVAGNGTVGRSPAKNGYADGDTVTLNAVPASGWAFKGWTGDTITTANPLLQLMGANKSLTATFEQVEPTETLITNVAAKTGNTYKLGNMHSGVVYYTDRAYSITSVPAGLVGIAAIYAPNNDKVNTSASVLSFDLSENATIIVAYDPRATKLPGWLTGWTKLADKLGVNDPKLASFNLYSKKYNKGKVTLGGNMASPAAGTLTQYIVLAKPANTALSAAKATTMNMSSDTLTAGASSGVNKAYIYPNPAVSNFTIVFPPNYEGIAFVKIIDFNGNTRSVNVADATFTQSSANFNVANLTVQPGLYSVIVTSKKGKNDLFRLIVK